MSADPVLHQLMALRPRITHIARAYGNRRGLHSEIDDLVQVATIAAWRSLRQPADSADHARNRALVAARGALIDHARSNCAHSRTDARLIARAAQIAPHTDLASVARQLGTDTDTLHRLAAAPHIATDAHADPAAPDLPLPDLMDQRRAVRRLPAALLQLSVQRRQVIQLLLIEPGVTLREIANRLRLNESAIARRLSAGLADLSRILHPPTPPPAAPPAVPDWSDLITGPVPARLLTRPTTTQRRRHEHRDR